MGKANMHLLDSTLSIIEICPIEMRDDNLVHLRVET